LRATAGLEAADCAPAANAPVTARMHAIFAASGVQTSVWADELAATDAALGDLRDGDFLLLLAHTDAGAVVERVRARVSPAVPLPL
jgi:hypothetical protein